MQYSGYQKIYSKKQYKNTAAYKDRYDNELYTLSSVL